MGNWFLDNYSDSENDCLDDEDSEQEIYYRLEEERLRLEEEEIQDFLDEENW